jgi:hypothetical protein
MFGVLNVKDWCLLAGGRSRHVVSIFVAAKGIMVMVQCVCTAIISEMKGGEI